LNLLINKSSCSVRLNLDDITYIEPIEKNMTFVSDASEVS